MGFDAVEGHQGNRWTKMRPEFLAINEIFLFKVDTAGCESRSFKCGFAQLQQIERKMHCKCIVCFNNSAGTRNVYLNRLVWQTRMKLHELQINGQTSSYFEC